MRVDESGPGWTVTYVKYGAVAIIALHSIAALAFPGSLWGLSPLAVWPRWVAIAWPAACVLLLFVRPGQGLIRMLWWPRGRVAAVGALVLLALFWVLRERTHFFGDGYLLIQDRGIPTSYARAPLLILLASRITPWAETRIGIPPEVTFAVGSALCGVAAVLMMARMCSEVALEQPARCVLFVLLTTCGAMQLFFGHVEYYAAVATGIVAYLWSVVRAMANPRGTAVTFVVFIVLVAMHVSALALLPAQLYLVGRSWKLGDRRPAFLVGTVVAITLVVLWAFMDVRPSSVLATVKGAALPFTRPESVFFAFGFMSSAHLLAVLNDLLWAAPLAVIGMPFLFLRLRGPESALRWFLLVAAAGCLSLSLLFDRGLGAYRDWDVLAPFAFVYLTGFAIALGSMRAARGSIAWILFVAGLCHLVPQVAMGVDAQRSIAHHKIALANRSQWSPFASAYLYESFAIYHRNRGERIRAFEAYRSAVEANPTDARLRVGLGNQYFGSGDLQSAIREYELALESRPDYAPGHNNLAFVLAESGASPERALEHAHSAVRIDPENAEYWMTLAQIEKRSGNVGAARRAAQRALELRPSLSAATQLLESLRVEGDR